MTDIRLFAENFYILDDGRVRQFLILGEDEALLIDTGFEDSNVYHTVKNITKLPVKVIMTHGDPDHAGGLKDFGKCYLHKGDWPLISEDIRLEPLRKEMSLSAEIIPWKPLKSPAIPTAVWPLPTGRKSCSFPGILYRKQVPFICWRAPESGPIYRKPEKTSGPSG